MNAIDWLLDSDPAIRWQAMRDLTAASPKSIAEERARVAGEGLGADILARQGENGAWNRADAPDWLSTLFTLQLLRACGVERTDPRVASAVALLQARFRWHEAFGKKPFFGGEVEPCINGGALALGAYFGHPTEALMRRLVSEQLADGGWNCDAPQSTRSSFNTTICVLEGLLEYEQAVGGAPDIAVVRWRGEEYLLKRALFRRLSTGEVADESFLKFAYPPRYQYDILRALDHLRNSGFEPDGRIREAVEFVDRGRQPDGCWLLDSAFAESIAMPLPFGETVGKASRWNTLRALRVLRWYEKAQGCLGETTRAKQ